MPQLGHLLKYVLGSTGAAVPGVSCTVYREGATVGGGQSGTSPLVVAVRHKGKIVVGDTVFIGTASTVPYNVNALTSTTITLGGFSGTLNLNDGDRLVPSGSQPTIYSDDQGGATASNPLTSSSLGMVQCYIEYGAYELLFSGGTITSRLEQAQVVPTEAPAQVRYADAFNYSGSTSGGIQEALNDLPSTGGKVLLSNKTYTVTAKVTIPSNATIEGCGMNSSIIQTGAGIAINILENSDTVSGNSYIKLRDLTIDGNKTNATGSAIMAHFKRVDGLWLDRVEVANSRGTGVYIQAPAAGAVKHVSIQGCYFHNTMANVTTNAEAALYIYTANAAVTQINVLGNLFENIGTDNATTSLSQSAITYNGANNDTANISDNIIYNSWCHGIHIAAAGNCNLNGNYIEKVGQQNVANGGNGIFMDVGSPCRLLVDGNTIDTIAANSDNGIECSGTAADAVIVGNRVRNVANANKNGIAVGGNNNAVITGNNVAGCAGVGIANLTDGPTASTGMSVTGNVCNANGLGGINLRGKGRIAVTGNDCSSSASGFGIQVGESITTSGGEATEITITGNTCVANAGGASGWGIRVVGELVGGGANLARRVAVCGNVLKGNTLDGLHLDACSNVVVTGNVISTNTRDGIRLNVSSTDTVVDANIISDNSGLGINLNGIAPTRFLLGNGNLFYNNTGGNSADVGMPAISGATPDVSGIIRARITDGVAKTNFTGGYDGQPLELIAVGGAITLTNGATLNLSGSADYVMASDDTVRLIRRNGNWYETGRGDNS